MNLRIALKEGDFLTAWVVSQGLCFMDLVKIQKRVTLALDCLWQNCWSSFGKGVGGPSTHIDRWSPYQLHKCTYNEMQGGYYLPPTSPTIRKDSQITITQPKNISILHVSRSYYYEVLETKVCRLALITLCWLLISFTQDTAVHLVAWFLRNFGRDLRSWNC
jgi:hypothetical protein